MRILIAEDDRSSRRLLTINLVSAGYEVVQAEDGRQAWEALQREHFRIVVTDWMMPELTGLDLIHRIRSESHSGYIYAILLTALEEKSRVLEGLAAGADDYLAKPYYSEELVARIKIGERILELEDRLGEAREQMEYQAMHDSLTGLLNRRAMQDHAEIEVKRAVRSSAPVGLLLIDLDDFKSVNDRLGHGVGDEALRLCARVLKDNVRSYDWMGRWGGEEFMCVLPGASPADSGLVAERARLAVECASLPIAGSADLKMTVSIGGASASGAAGSLELDKLISAADGALYKAKGSGRNRVCVAE